ncbi:putative SNF2 family N-terminal domain-containing protein [Trypanosoma grayi]|uniref:putative SNF2 family N-terminal domain-containing protein n=1 Tax=Trypanosoma grayi TaxID=71804 RepID=UPI0004F48D5F|nr:putative SNF2 family N-terminal domain-containing protein [Trypanosoma grayi]KEG07885.1 putative SNF2 family N-terminal domain-containing protein [Trypanosoma grayi]
MITRRQARLGIVGDAGNSSGAFSGRAAVSASADKSRSGNPPRPPRAGARIRVAELKAAWRSVVRDVVAVRRRSENVSQQQKRWDALCREVHDRAHLSAHRERLRLLLEDRNGDGEAAYVAALQSRPSEKGAQVLAVLASIDAQLKRALLAVYAPRHTGDDDAPVDGRTGPTGGAQTRPMQRLQLGHQEDDHDDGCGVNASGGVEAAPFEGQHARCLAAVERCVAESLRRTPGYALLMPHQQEGVRWLLRLSMAERMHGVLADDMGLGKTAQSVVFLSCYKLALESLQQQQQQQNREATLADALSWVLQEDPKRNTTTTAAAAAAAVNGTTTAAVALSGGAVNNGLRRRGRKPAHEMKCNIVTGVTSPMRPVLIVAPLSTLPHWQDELERFGLRDVGRSASSPPPPPLLFTAYVLNGSREERVEVTRRFLSHAEQQQQPATPVLVAPHDMFVRPLHASMRRLRHVLFHVTIVDEAHRIKNAESVLFNKLSQLKSTTRLVLTGTPLQNNVAELFSLLQFLTPQMILSRRSGKELMERLDGALMHASRSGALEDEELHLLLCRRVHALVSPFVLRRELSLLQHMLPPKREFTIWCPMLPLQRDMLEQLELKRQCGRLVGNATIHARKLLLHPYTTEDAFYIDEDVISSSGKMLVLDFMMRFLCKTQHKFLVFCSWTLVLDIVETVCQMRGMPFVRLDGKTSVDDRKKNIARFNNAAAAAAASPTAGSDEVVNDVATGGRGGSKARASAVASALADASDPKCFLISKVAGGVGLNLQSADTVFMLDVDYNPMRDAQALSRVYRMGQTREVRVYRLVVDHPVERGMLQISAAKENLNLAVVHAGKYDLHSSAAEREEALQSVFHRIQQQQQEDEGEEEEGSRRGCAESVPAYALPSSSSSCRRRGSLNKTSEGDLEEKCEEGGNFRVDGDQTPRLVCRKRIRFEDDNSDESETTRRTRQQRAVPAAPLQHSLLLAMRDVLREALVRTPTELQLYEEEMEVLASAIPRAS